MPAAKEEMIGRNIADVDQIVRVDGIPRMDVLRRSHAYTEIDVVYIERAQQFPAEQKDARFPEKAAACTAGGSQVFGGKW